MQAGSKEISRETKPSPHLGRPQWFFWPVAAALVVALPLGAILGYWTVPDEGSWAHLSKYVLTDYILNSFGLLIGVAILTGTIGLVTAWLVAAYDFPGRSAFEWMLFLPLALPTYIIAFTYGGFMDELGPVQTLTRSVLGTEAGTHLPFPEIRSLPGVILVMSLVLYPYVYLICRAVITNQIQHLSDMAQVMGLSGPERFFRVALPLVRPALVAGIGLAVMEALGDFGSVSFYGVPTFTTGIYRTWFNLGDLASAARLSSLLMLFMLALILVERFSRRKIQVGMSNQPVETRRIPLNKKHAFGAVAACAVPIFLGFALPVTQLAIWAVTRLDILASPEYRLMLGRTLALGLSVAGGVVLLAVMIRFAQRLLQSPAIEVCNRIASMGYAIPGSVLSVGILIPLVRFDQWLSQQTQAWFGWSLGLVLSGSVIALAYSYAVRFLAVAYNTVDGAFARTSRQLDEAALCLGSSPGRILRSVHIPVIRGSLLAAGALVLIDIMKELPATLILRPFNFDTLATKTYELASEEMLPEAAIYALSIVVAGLLPIWFLVHSIQQRKSGLSRSQLP